MVLAAMKSKGHTNRFKTFCKSETMDSFLHACIDYFLVFFKLADEKEKVKSDGKAARDALADGKAPPDTAGSASDSASAPPPPAASVPTSREIYELELEQRARLKEVALVYATILLKPTTLKPNYANTQQERQFFESLYDFAKRVLFTINQRKNWHAIENELDVRARRPAPPAAARAPPPLSRLLLLTS